MVVESCLASLHSQDEEFLLTHYGSRVFNLLLLIIIYYQTSVIILLFQIYFRRCYRKNAHFLTSRD